MSWASLLKSAGSKAAMQSWKENGDGCLQSNC